MQDSRVKMHEIAFSAPENGPAARAFTMRDLSMSCRAQVVLCAKLYPLRLIASAAVIPETPTALSGTVTNAGAREDPGYGASAVPG